MIGGYLYRRDLQKSRNGQRDWVAGRRCDLGVIVVTLPPGSDQKLLIDQRIPRAMHILVYQLPIPDTLTPAVDEGLASQVELYPNSDYPILLEDAVKREALIPIASLCQTFPRDASSALLSYAQAASFTKYLYTPTAPPGWWTWLKHTPTASTASAAPSKLWG
jgi:hypothetical protein